MEEKKDKEKNEKLEEEKKTEGKVETSKEETHKRTKTLLNIFLAIIVIVLVITFGIIYYYLNKYANSDQGLSNGTGTDDSKDVSTVADIIDTALSTNTTNNLVNGTTNIINSTATLNTTVSTNEADGRQVLNESIIVLYDGMILDNQNMGIVDLKYIDNSNPNKDNYVITYYNYENYGYKDSTLGTLSTQVVDGLVKIDNVGKVAISEKYNAIPREIQVVNAIPAVVLDNNSDFANYDTKKTIISDLDGNGTNEYIVILSNKTTGESRIVLCESTGFVKATIAKMDKSGWDGVSSDGYFLSYSNIEVLDIDNDGIMEILFEIPNSTGTPKQIDLLKYKNGDLTGNTDYTCSLIN